MQQIDFSMLLIDMQVCYTCIIIKINPRRHKVKKVTRRHKGGGGGLGSIGPLPSTFDTIHPIE